MPVFRYFVFVGGALLALLFALNLALPQDVGTQSTIVSSSGEAPLIRIHSEAKLPERIVLDTSQPTVLPPAMQTAAVVTPQPQSQPRAEPLSGLARERVRDTFAQFVPPEHKAGVTTARRTEAAVEATTESRPELRTTEVKPQPRHRVARARPAPYPGRPLMLVAQQPRYGFFNTTW